MILKNRNIQYKILFLYSELAEYTVACLNKLVETHAVEVHLVRWEINKEAPFDFSLNSDIHIYERENLSDSELLLRSKAIEPDLIYCSGWMDKGYLPVCSFFSEKIPVIAGIDNHWEGTAKQQFAKMISSLTIHKWFTHAWVPGELQKTYALHLGFEETDILPGLYSADVDHFHDLYQQTFNDKKKQFPHRFLFVGRYIKEKGLPDLISAFNRLRSEQDTDWELWCCGTGPLENEIPDMPGIKHLGFVQPEDMNEIVHHTGVFILPSHFEPWGVVVHEFAAAGFPLICSDKVGAATTFLEEDKNGLLFKKGNTDSLFDKMQQMVNTSDNDLLKMGIESHKISTKITPESWCKSLLSTIENERLKAN